MFVISLIIAVSMVYAGGIAWQRNEFLLRYGNKAEGIIFKNNLVKGMYYPVVRFLTDKHEWITEELNTGYQRARKEGEKLEILYNPENPIQFEVNSTYHLQIIPVLFMAAGLILLSLTILQLLGLIELV